MGKLENTVAMVTGVTEDMALATARRFAEEGPFCVYYGCRREKLDEAAVSIGRNVRGVRCDSASLSDLDRLYSTVRKEKARSTSCLPALASGDFAPTEAVTEESSDAIFDLNGVEPT